MNLPKGTVHGILQTLREVGFVEQDPDSGKYQLGAALLHMGSSYLDGNELRTRALNWSDSLAARANESVRIGTLHEMQVLIVHHVFRPDDTVQALDVGTLRPAHATAMGKVLLSSHEYLLPDLDLPAFTPNTITDRATLAGELAKVREQGYAHTVSELMRGEASIAAPILDRRGATVGAMSISGAVDRLCTARHRPRMELVGYVRE